MQQIDKEILIFGAMACLTIIITGFIIPSAWAETIYSGDTIEIPTGLEIVNCSVINSTYDLEGL